MTKKDKVVSDIHMKTEFASNSDLIITGKITKRESILHINSNLISKDIG